MGESCKRQRHGLQSEQRIADATAEHSGASGCLRGDRGGRHRSGPHHGLVDLFVRALTCVAHPARWAMVVDLSSSFRSSFSFCSVSPPRPHKCLREYRLSSRVTLTAMAGPDLKEVSTDFAHIPYYVLIYSFLSLVSLEDWCGETSPNSFSQIRPFP